MTGISSGNGSDASVAREVVESVFLGAPEKAMRCYIELNPAYTSAEEPPKASQFGEESDHDLYSEVGQAMRIT